MVRYHQKHPPPHLSNIQIGDLCPIISVTFQNHSPNSDTPTSHSDWPAVWKWERGQGLNHCFFILDTTICCSSHVTNQVQHYQRLLQDCVKMCAINPVFKQYHILPPLSATAGFSLCPSVWLFGPTTNDFDIVGRHILQTSSDSP